MTDRAATAWIRPSEARIENAVDSIIDMVRAFRSMNDLMAPEARAWEPSSFTRNQWRVFAQDMLRADARYRSEHPEEPA